MGTFASGISTDVSADQPRIPVVVLAGFLGSGKTTLLNHLLQDDHGIKLAVIVNDFGTIPVDAILVAGQVDSLVSMANGCLCCQSSDEELDKALDQLAHTDGVEGIVIEASGLAEPQVLMSMVATATTVTDVSVGGLIEVIDAGEVKDTVQQHPTVLRRLHNADLIVLNKADRLERSEVASVRRLLKDAAPAVMVVTTAYGRVDARVLFDRPDKDPQTFAELVSDHAHHDHGHVHENGDGHSHHHDHLHDSYRTVSVTLDNPLHPARFMDFVRNGAGGAYRVKGFIQLAGPQENESFVFEKTGQHIALQRWFPQTDEAGAVRSADSAESAGQSGLVFIGVSLDDDAIAAACDDCVWKGADIDPVTEGELWSFYPYLEDVSAEPDDYWWDEQEEESGIGEDYLLEPEEDPTFLP